MTSSERPADELANLLTHGFGFLLSLAASTYLLLHVASHPTLWVVACGIYSTTLVLLYGSSTLSHLFHETSRRRYFRTLDQACIFLLIAGTYTPFAVIYLHHDGWPLVLVTMWMVALAGVGRVIWVRDLTALDKVAYGVMGLLPAITLQELDRVAPAGTVTWIIAGGICYYLGTPFLKLSPIVRYSHAVWHLFVVAGSACHYRAILLAV